MKTAFKISWDSTIFDRPAALHFFFFAPLPCIIIVLLCVTNASGSVVKGEKKRGYVISQHHSHISPLFHFVCPALCDSSLAPRCTGTAQRIAVNTQLVCLVHDTFSCHPLDRSSWFARPKICPSTNGPLGADEGSIGKSPPLLRYHPLAP